MSEAVTATIEYIRSTKRSYNWSPKKSDEDWGASGGSNVMCGMTDEKGKVKHDFYPCHMPLQNYRNAHIVWSAWACRTKAVVQKTFREWLCYNSPWAKIGAVPAEVSGFGWDEGFIFTNLDQIPGNKLHNFLVASRMGAEWPNHIEAWYDLVTKHDLDPSFAFFWLTVFLPLNDEGYCRSTAFDKGRTSCLSFADKYDWPLDTGRCGEEYLINFLKGKTPGLSKDMFFPSAKTAPVNTLWGKLYEPEDREKRYPIKLFNLYGEKFGKSRPSAARAFAGYSVSSKNMAEDGKKEYRWAFEPEEVIEIAKLEYDRIRKEHNIES